MTRAAALSEFGGMRLAPQRLDRPLGETWMSIGSLVLAVLCAAGAGLLWRRRADDPPTDWPLRAARTIGPIKSEPVGPAPPRFSVIVPTYNRGRVLMEAIESVLAQRAGDFELIVVDDGGLLAAAARGRAGGDGAGRPRDVPLAAPGGHRQDAGAHGAPPAARVGGRIRRALAQLRRLGAPAPAGPGDAVRLHRSPPGG